MTLSLLKLWGWLAISNKPGLMIFEDDIKCMKKILVIEDNLDVRENLSEILELSGYRVSTAEDGKKGVELAISEKPDLIICDVMMPKLDEPHH